MIAGSGADKIHGSGAANTIQGGAGNDTIWGGGGNDVLTGGSGHDKLFGDDGNDTFLAKDGRTDTLDGGAGFDTAQRDNSATARSAEHRAIRLNVLSGVYVIPVAADVLADVSDPISESPIEVDESDFETLGEKSADRALASTTGADEANLHDLI